jgi:hypothetical protein
MKLRGGVSYRGIYPPSPSIAKSILRKRKHEPNNNGIAYAINDYSSTTDDNNNYNPGLAIALTPDNDFRKDLNNDHTVNNDISYDIADEDIDSLQKLRDKHNDSETRGNCLDDFITYHVAPELKIRPSYEVCLKENEAEIAFYKSMQ